MLFIHLILTTLAYTVGDIYTGDISLPLFKIADFSPIILKKQFSEKLHQEISSGKLDNFPSVSTFSWNWLLLTLVRMCRLQIMVAQNEMIDLISIYDQIKVRVRLERTWLASQVMAGWTWLMDSTRQFDFIYTGAVIFSELTSSLTEHNLFQKDRWSQNNNHVIIIRKRITSKNDRSSAWTCDIINVLIVAEWRRSCTDPAGVAFFPGAFSLLQNSDSWLIWLLAYPVQNIDI